MKVLSYPDCRGHCDFYYLVIVLMVTNDLKYWGNCLITVSQYVN